MSEILEEPPDENEAFENLDEALDDVDAQRGFSGGPEGQRDLGSELVIDEQELEEAGANLDDPDRISLLEGGMDDPDGMGIAASRRSGQAEGAREEGAGEDYDAIDVDGGHPREEDEFSDDVGAGPGEEPEIDPELEIIDVDPEKLDQLPDDSPGPGSARW